MDASLTCDGHTFSKSKACALVPCGQILQYMRSQKLNRYMLKHSLQTLWNSEILSLAVDMLDLEDDSHG